MSMKQPLLVISGPSGVGKSTLLTKLFKRYPNSFGFSVSHTTRKPRPGEEDGKSYHFVTREAMLEDIQANKFIEHAEFSGNMYGTSIKAIQDVQDAGKVCVLDVELNGIKSIKQQGLAAKFIFISPPSVEDLEKRLRGRGTETEESLQKRLASAKAELEYSKEENAHDLIVVNDVADRAFTELEAFIKNNWESVRDAVPVEEEKAPEVTEAPKEVTEPVKSSEVEAAKPVEAEPVKPTEAEPVKPAETEPAKPTEAEAPKPAEAPKETVPAATPASPTPKKKKGCIIC